MSAPTSSMTVAQASEHLWQELSHHSVTLDLGANDPVVRALSEYGDACRVRDDAKVKVASKHLWEAMSHHQVTLDLGAHDPVVKAVVAYGDACRREGAVGAT